MNEDLTEAAELDPAEVAEFCFRRLARLEARFILLCLRAQAAGVDCTDLCDVQLPQEWPPGRLRLVD